MRTFSPTHIVAGLLFCLGSLSPLPAAAAGEAELGDLLVKMIQAGRTVMAKHQVEINNPDLVDKGFTPEIFEKEITQKYLEIAKFDLSQAPKTPQDKLVHALLQASKEVVLVLDGPELPFSPRDCNLRPLATWIKSCRVSRAQAEQRQDAVRSAAKLLQAEVSNLRVFDPLEVLCDRTWCAVDRGGMLAFYDSHHFSVRGSRLVARPLIEFIRGGVPGGMSAQVSAPR